ncbi:MAG: hypothetical protein Q9225_001037 [Loekoesia sp. 1 TL-2023]
MPKYPVDQPNSHQSFKYTIPGSSHDFPHRQFRNPFAEFAHKSVDPQEPTTDTRQNRAPHAGGIGEASLSIRANPTHSTSRKPSYASTPTSTPSSSSSKRGSVFINLVSSEEEDDVVEVTPKKPRRRLIEEFNTHIPEPQLNSEAQENAFTRNSSSSIHDHPPQPQKFRAVEIPIRKPTPIVPRAPLAVAQRDRFLKNLSELRGPRVTVINEIDESSPSVSFRFVDESILGRGVSRAPDEVRLEIFKTSNRGWGLRCPVDLRKGDFIDTYRGEIITVEEANKRGTSRSVDEGNYFMNFDKFTEPEAITKSEFLERFPYKISWHRKKVLDHDWEIFVKDGHEMWLNPEYVPYLYVCDGMHVGGSTRFMNHSCDPNCRLFTVSYNHSDPHLYDLAFFTLEAIPAGTELTFDYKDEDDRSVITHQQALEVKRRDGYMPQKCLCGTAECRQYFFN